MPCIEVSLDFMTSPIELDNLTVPLLSVFPLHWISNVEIIINRIIILKKCIMIVYYKNRWMKWKKSGLSLLTWTKFAMNSGVYTHSPLSAWNTNFVMIRMISNSSDFWADSSKDYAILHNKDSPERKRFNLVLISLFTLPEEVLYLRFLPIWNNPILIEIKIDQIIHKTKKLWNIS